MLFAQLKAYLACYIFTLLTITHAFEFKNADVSASPLTISSTAAYTITLLRQISATGTSTPSSTEAVPAGATITITFPVQYTLSGAETCSSLLIDFALVQTFTTSVDVNTRVFTISGAITQPAYIQSVILTIEGVTNPSPALVSSAFATTIGTDFSAIDVGTQTSSSVSLEPGQLQSATVTFDPSSINTTSSMIVSIVNLNSIEAGGQIEVVFPETMRWSREISAGHILPIASTMGCSSIANTHFTLSCSGNSNTATVTISNLFNSEVEAGTTITFSINNLFSPPTTEPNLDEITIITYDLSLGTAYKVDQSSTHVSGLTALSSSMTISSSSTMTINTFIPLTFKFSLLTTVSNLDYFVFSFPAGSTINYVTKISNDVNISINTAASTSTSLRFDISSSNANLPTNKSISILIFNYKTPPSAKTTSQFTLTVMNSGYSKMSYFSTITPVPKSYIATLSADNTLINAETTYRIVVPLADALSSTGYITVTIPPQLTLSASPTVSLSGSSIATTPVLTRTSSTMLTLTSLNTSSLSIGVQSLTISISGLTNPSSVQQVSAFSLQLFYSSSDDLVANCVTTTSIVLRPGEIQTVTITPATSVTANADVEYAFGFALQDPIEAGGTLVVSVPEDVGVASGADCSINGVNAECTVINGSIIFTTAAALSENQQITLRYSGFENPDSTRPTSLFNLNTYQPGGNLVNTLTTSLQSSLTITMTTPSELPAATLTRSSKQNSMTTFYTLTFTQPQPINEASAAVVFSLPAQIQVDSSALTCSFVTSCRYEESEHAIVGIFTPLTSQNAGYEVRMGGLTNPYSMAPTSESIAIQTKTADLMYSYSQKNTGLIVTNTIPSSFIGLTYQFSNQVLSDQTDLTLEFSTQSLPTNQSVSYLEVMFAPTFSVSQLSSISCQSPHFTPICTLEQNPTNSYYQMKIESGTTIPDAFTLTFSPLTTPSTIPSDYTWVTSYDDAGYKISQSQNLVIFTTFCTFPCRQCSNSTPTLCLSCYDTSLTTKIYLHDSNCISTCPSTFFENELDLVCQACQLPCFECNGTANYCTFCDVNTSYIYLNTTATTSTCLASCPAFMYADTTQVPNICASCVSPCSKCTTEVDCETCISGYYLYEQRCLSACPADVTVVNGDSCIDCSAECATCAISRSNCTSCSDSAALYNGSCIFDCPGDLIVFNQECVACDAECQTCELSTDNCTSCFVSSSVPYYYENQCLDQCPNFYYPDTFKQCQSCALENIGCKNCSSPTVCLSCDQGFVLLQQNCLNSTPEGYLNISGTALACLEDCETCSVTLTNCTSCKTLNLFETTCLANCPSGTISIDQRCVACAYPCDTCANSTDKCLSCQSNSSLYLQANLCVAATLCLPATYPNSLSQQCSPCQSPCVNCESLTECTSCISGYFLLNDTKSCETSCPVGMVGINRVCYDCESPCEDCIVSTIRCTSCISGFFYNENTNECLDACPVGLIENYTSMECVLCQSPCKTCQNTTQTCLSCVSGTFLSGTECVALCPEGEFGAAGLCQECINNCSTCNSAVLCLSCAYPLYLFSEECIEQCPVTHSITNDSQCISCQTIVVGCSNCSDNGECYECFSPRIYFNGDCLTSCPSGYALVNFECVVSNNTDVVEEVLNQVLTNEDVFPLPFTILAGVFIFATFMSKLQNKNTYVLGSLYSLIGLQETGCIVYLLYRYYSIGAQNYDQLYIFLMLGVIGLIYILNILGFFIQTSLLLFDKMYAQWLRVCRHKCFYSFAVIFSLIINYKFRMIVFSRLFKFSSFGARLQSVSKFRIYNIFSFFGLLPEGLALFICFILMPDYKQSLVLYYAFLDVIIINILNILLALFISWKSDDFFHEQDDDFTLHKKINIEGDDFSKEAIEPGIEYDNYQKGYEHGEGSYSVIKGNVIEEEDYESSFTGHDYEEEERRRKAEEEEKEKEERKRKEKQRTKIYFTNYEETSNPLRRQAKSRNKYNKGEEEKTRNIFSGLTIEHENQHQIEKDFHYQSEYFSDHKSQDLEFSEAGGSDKMIINASPLKSEKLTKEVIYAGENKQVSNIATDNEDIVQKISKRELELDEIKKEMNEKQKIRKEKRKELKKNKKSIDSIEVPIRSIKKTTIDFEQEEKGEVEQQSEKEEEANVEKSEKQIEASYEELTIKDSSQKDMTEMDTGTIEVKNVEKVYLDEEQRQESVDDQIQSPRKTVGSWIELKVNEQNKDLPIYTHANQSYNTLSGGMPSEKDETIEYNIEIGKGTEKEKWKDKKKGKKIEGEENKEKKDQRQLQEKGKKEKLNKEQELDTITREIEEYENERKGKVLMQEKQMGERREENQGQGNSEKLISDSSLDSGRQNKVDNILKIESGRKGEEQLLQGEREAHKGNIPFSKGEESLDKFLTSSQKTKQLKKKPEFYEFEDQDENLEEERNTKMNFYKNESQSGLEDSHHEEQKINERPYTAVKRKGLSNNEALLEILDQAEKDRQKVRKSLNAVRRIPKDGEDDRYYKKEERPGGFHYTGPKFNEIGGEGEERKSQMYRAGLHQIDQDNLRKKHSLNHPLSSKKKITSHDESEVDSSINEIHKSRNKSFNTASIYKKFTSKDLSVDQLDEIQFNKMSLKDDYSHLLNQRKTEGSGDKSNRKMHTSGASRINRPDSSVGSINMKPMMRKMSIKKEGEDEKPEDDEHSLAYDYDQLQDYYNRGESVGRKLGSKDKKDLSREKKDVSRERKKELSREKSSEAKKRFKHLERIYLPSPKK